MVTSTVQLNPFYKFVIRWLFSTNHKDIRTLYLIFGAIIIFFSCNANSLKETSFFFIPSTWQVLIESLYEASLQLLFDNINKDGEKYFPFISVVFTFVLFSNLIGLIPYSFTTTSHLIVTFTLSLSIFVGINISFSKKSKNVNAGTFKYLN